MPSEINNKQRGLGEETEQDLPDYRKNPFRTDLIPQTTQPFWDWVQSLPPEVRLTSEPLTEKEIEREKKKDEIPKI